MSELATNGFLFGGDYNPEQWSEEVWREDVRLMQQAGVNAATVGVFSWALLEPEEGVYEFGWLDRVLDVLHEGGIGVILATPTASPPPWFSSAHPDALPVDEDGTQKWHGSRDTYCLSAPAYRAASTAIARRLAERYADHPAVLAWHIHNEYGTLCWCDHVAGAFRTWLRRRYGSLEALNQAWYTSFWSQHYVSWDDVLPPRKTQYRHNPPQAVDFRRFSSDELLACFTEQRDVIRAAGSDHPVTHNFMLPTWNHLEQWSWAAEEDFVSIDHYLDTTGPDGEAFVGYASDLTRSWGGGRPWLLMEQGTSTISLGDHSASKEPGRFLRNALSYLAHGSQGSLYFQWRAPAAGSEAWVLGLVPHVGPDSRIFRETVQLGEVLQRISEVAAAPADRPVVSADVAVLWHADSWWALEDPSLPSARLNFSDSVRSVHRALWQEGVAVDFVRPGADLSGYRLVLVPSLYVSDDATVQAFQDYVDQGGSLAVWYFSGIADEQLHIAAGGYPGRLRELLGVRVEELHPLAADASVALSDGSTGTTWSEFMSLTSAESLVSYVGGALDGAPAITRRPVSGGGAAFYVSTRLPDDALRGLVRTLCVEAGVEPVLGFTPPEGIEVVRRAGAEHDYLFVLNHGQQPARLQGPGLDLVTGEPCGAGLRLAAGAVAVVREDAPVGAPSARWSLGLL